MSVPGSSRTEVRPGIPPHWRRPAVHRRGPGLRPIGSAASHASSTNKHTLTRDARSTRSSRFLGEERADGVDGRVGKLLVHGEFALGEPSGSNAADRGERLHFRARPRRRLGAVDQEDRNRRAPRQIEKRVAARERIETAGDEAHRREPGSRRAHYGELLAQTLALEERGIRIDVAGAHAPHDERVDVQAIDEWTEPGTIDEAAQL